MNFIYEASIKIKENMMLNMIIMVLAILSAAGKGQAVFVPALEEDTNMILRLVGHLRDFQKNTKDFNIEDDFIVEDRGDKYAVLLKGDLPQDEASLISLTQRVERKIINSEEQTPQREVYFLGSKSGGSVAALLAKNLKKIYSQSRENQFKVIAFSPSSISLDDCEEIKSVIGQSNVLTFYDSTSHKSIPVFGVPICFLLSEIMWDRKDKMVIGAGGGGTFAWLTARTVPVGFFLSLSPICYAVTLTASALGAAVVLPLKDFQENPIPSDELIRRAFQYAQDNFQHNEFDGVDLSTIGIPPALSSSRGLSGGFMRLLGN